MAPHELVGQINPRTIALLLGNAALCSLFAGLLTAVKRVRDQANRDARAVKARCEAWRDVIAATRRQRNVPPSDDPTPDDARALPTNWSDRVYSIE